MKLKNKKTGEIDDFIFEVITDRIDLYRRVGHSETKNIWHYNSLAELYKEWEDAPEKSKEYWFIYGNQVLKNECDGVIEDRFKEIGNYFETEEEAEKALEKLKAVKRLKDKGFRFTHWMTDRKEKSGKVGFKCDEIRLTFNEARQFYADLSLIFGGE